MRTRRMVGTVRDRRQPVLVGARSGHFGHTTSFSRTSDRAFMDSCIPRLGQVSAMLRADPMPAQFLKAADCMHTPGASLPRALRPVPLQHHRTRRSGWCAPAQNACGGVHARAMPPPSQIAYHHTHSNGIRVTPIARKPSSRSYFLEQPFRAAHPSQPSPQALSPCPSVLHPWRLTPLSPRGRPPLTSR